MPKRGLGKGLEALIPQRVDRGKKEILDIPVDRIIPNRYQPRKEFEGEPFQRLVESVKAQGIIQPVLVTRGAAGWELVAGERRWRAAREAGLTSIPAVVRETTSPEKVALALIENILRQDLNPIEVADALKRLIEEFEMTQEEVADRTGLSRPGVANYLRLLSLPDEARHAILKNELSMGQAKALLGLSGRTELLEALRKVITKGLSVRETEDLVRKLKADHKAKPVTTRPPYLDDLEEELLRRLGTMVRIVPKKKGGEIRINYHSDEELDRLINVMRNEGKRL